MSDRERKRVPEHSSDVLKGSPPTRPTPTPNPRPQGSPRVSEAERREREGVKMEQLREFVQFSGCMSCHRPILDGLFGNVSLTCQM